MRFIRLPIAVYSSRPEIKWREGVIGVDSIIFVEKHRLGTEITLLPGQLVQTTLAYDDVLALIEVATGVAITGQSNG